MWCGTIAAGLDVHIEFPQSHCSFVQIYAFIRDFPITTLPNGNMVKKLCSPSCCRCREYNLFYIILTSYNVEPSLLAHRYKTEDGIME